MKQYFVPFKELRSLTRGEKFAVLSLIPLYFIVIGLFFSQSTRSFRNYTDRAGAGRTDLRLFCSRRNWSCPDQCGAYNSAQHCPSLFFGKGDGRSYHYFQLSDVRIFSFGKNIVNIWAIMAGVVLYAKYHGTSLKRYLYVGLYGTSLSPIMTQMMHIGKFPAPVCLMLSLLLGLAIGFVLPPLCTHVHYAHQGYSLYNVGFGAGIIATVVVSLAKSFGIKVESRLIWSVGNNTLFAVLLMSLFGCMIASAVAVRGKTILESYRRILKTSGIGGTDYLKDEGGATTVFNMGVNGLFATLFVLAVKGI